MNDIYFNLKQTIFAFLKDLEGKIINTGASLIKLSLYYSAFSEVSGKYYLSQEQL